MTLDDSILTRRRHVMQRAQDLGKRDRGVPRGRDLAHDSRPQGRASRGCRGRGRTQFTTVRIVNIRHFT